MEVPTVRKLSVLDQRRGQKNVVCTYWLAGRCKKNPCRFLHCEQSKLAQSKLMPPKKTPPRNMTWRNPGCSIPNTGTGSSNEAYMFKNTSNGHMRHEVVIASTLTAVKTKPENHSVQKTQPQQCKYWVTGNCDNGDKCKYIHSWFSGSGFTLLAKLEGHTEGITGISLPSGCDKLYSCGKDKTIRAWDCHSGQCAGSLPTVDEIGCLFAEGEWVLVGLQNRVKAWNVQNQAEFSFNVPAGLVCNMVTDNIDTLFAGIEDGSILVWKLHLEMTNITEPTAILKEHLGPICSLVVGSGNRLYSGSRDCTIKVWDRQSFQCLHTLSRHRSHVTSVICWDSYLLSASLDNTIKVWALTEEGNLEVVYERKEESEVIALCGIHDGEDKPILLCSCNDNTVRLYDVPSFLERGRIFSRGNVEVVHSGIEGLFFTGDATGEICVWKLLGVPASTAS